MLFRFCLLKGSSLEDLPAAIAKFHDKLGAKDHDFTAGGVAGAGIMLSPELLAEIGRVRGWAVAIPSINKKGEPEFVSILLTGDSEIVPMMFRAYLLVSEGIRSVGEVDGIRIYQDKSEGKKGKPPSDLPMPPFNPKDFMSKGEFNIALAPGMVVFGSSTDGVKDVLSRIGKKGEVKTKTLAGSKGFQTAAKLRENGGGLFFYADMDRLGKLMETLASGSADNASWDVVKTFINPKAFHAVAGSLMLRKGGIDVRIQANVDVKDAGPLVELIPDRPANLELLQYLPADSLAGQVIPIPDGEKRWQKLLKLVDAAAKMSGKPGDPLPSAEVEKFEVASGIKIGKDICGRINEVAIGMPSTVNPGKPGKDDREKTPTLVGASFPIIVIEATNADAAGALEDLIPKLIGFATQSDAPKVTTEETDGIKIKCIADNNLPWHASVCFGHKGKILIIGQESKTVAACLNQGGTKKGLLAQAKVAAAIKDLDKPAVASLWLIGETVRYYSAMSKGSGSTEDKFDQEMKKVVENLPPLLSSLTVKSDSIVLEVRQPGLKSVSAKMIDLLVEKALQEYSEAKKPLPVPPIP